MEQQQQLEDFRTTLQNFPFFSQDKFGSKRVKKLFKEFTSLKSDVEHYLFALKLQGEQELPDVDPRLCKSSEKSRELREEGNAQYKAGNHQNALNSYVSSIAFAPADSEDLALAYANRSAVLKDMKNPLVLSALRDIKLALDGKYPLNLRYKLLFRQGVCLMSVGRNEEGVKSFLAARMALDVSDLPFHLEVFWRNKISSAHTVARRVFLNNVEPPLLQKQGETVIPTFKGKANKRIPSVSNKVTVAYTRSKGRHLVATQDIMPGEDVVIEEAFATIPMYSNNMSHSNCSHCQCLCYALLPCDKCVVAMYCNEECRQKAAKVHAVECWAFPLLMTLDINFEYILNAKCILVAGIDSVKDFLVAAKNHNPRETSKESAGFDEHGRYISTDFRTLYEIGATMSKSYNPATLLNSVLPQVIVIQVLKPVLPKNHLNDFGGLLVRLSQSCFDELFTRYFVSVGKFYKHKFGVARFNTGHLINHSCDPSIFNCFIGNIIIFKAIKPIKLGEELTRSYGPFFLSEPRLSRKKGLLRSAYFDCQCEACVNNWPMHDSLPDLPGHLSSKQKKMIISLTNDIIKVEMECMSMFQKNLLLDADDTPQALELRKKRIKSLPNVVRSLVLLEEWSGRLCKDYNKIQIILMMSMEVIETISLKVIDQDYHGLFPL